MTIHALLVIFGFLVAGIMVLGLLLMLWFTPTKPGWWRPDHGADSPYLRFKAFRQKQRS